MDNSHEGIQTDGRIPCSFGDVSSADSWGDVIRTSIHAPFGPNWNDSNAGWRAGEFYRDFSSNALMEFESLAAPHWCEGTTVLLTDGQAMRNIIFLLEGAVKVTMNLMDGKRQTLGIAVPGEVLGLVAGLSGLPCEITAITLVPSRITSLPRQSFLEFLLRYPIACQNSARLLSAEYERGCEQLRLCEVS